MAGRVPLLTATSRPRVQRGERSTRSRRRTASAREPQGQGDQVVREVDVARAALDVGDAGGIDAGLDEEVLAERGRLLLKALHARRVAGRRGRHEVRVV